MYFSDDQTLSSGKSLGGRLVKHFAFRDAVNAGNPGNSGLRADGDVAVFDKLADFFDRFLDVAAVGVAVDHHFFAALSAQQIVERRFKRLSL